MLHSYFQVSPEMLDWVQIRALAGPLKDIHKLVPKPLLCCLGCVFRIVVLMEGERSPQCVILSSLEQVWFSSMIFLYFVPFIFPSILTILSVSATQKHPDSMMLPPPSFTVGMAPGFLQM